MMAESSVRPSAGGVARRRRERRLRSWWRHEQQTVRMALAAATHHSAQQNAAPRGPKTGARVREGVEHEQHDGLRAQKPPLPGVRPGSLFDPGPQRSDRTVRHSAGEAPLLVVPSLRGADGVDGTTVSFLLAENLKLQKKEEEEKERRRKREEAEHEARMRELHRRVMAGEQLNPAESYAWRKWRGFLPSEPRGKKKRKKKKLPRAPRPRQGCRRPCDLQRQVPAVQVVHVFEGAPATIHRQSGGHSCFSCRDVYPQCKLCSTTWSSYRCCSWTVPPPGIGGVGFVRFPTFHEAHHLRVVSAIVSGLGMNMDFVDPVSSGKYSGTFLFTAPVAEPIVMSFTVPLLVLSSMPLQLS